MLQLDLVDDLAAWVLEDDQLVRDDAIDDLLFLGLALGAIDERRVMELCLAARLTLLAIQN